MLDRFCFASLLSMALFVPQPALSEDLSFIVDQTVNWTDNCEKGWYLLQQADPMFSHGKPVYVATSHYKLHDGPVLLGQGQITNRSTDFGANVTGDLRELRYKQSVKNDQERFRVISTGYIVATKHVALEDGVRSTCIFAEHRSIDGYAENGSLAQSSGTPIRVRIRRYVGEMDSNLNSWEAVTLGSARPLKLSLKVEVK